MEDKEMKQGQKVKWVDGMGFEHKGVVDWEATQWTATPVPIRDVLDDVIRWIDIEKLEEVHKTNGKPKPRINAEGIVSARLAQVPKTT